MTDRQAKIQRHCSRLSELVESSQVRASSLNQEVSRDPSNSSSPDTMTMVERAINEGNQSVRVARDLKELLKFPYLNPTDKRVLSKVRLLNPTCVERVRNCIKDQIEKQCALIAAGTLYCMLKEQDEFLMHLAAQEINRLSNYNCVGFFYRESNPGSSPVPIKIVLNVNAELGPCRTEDSPYVYQERILKEELMKEQVDLYFNRVHFLANLRAKRDWAHPQMDVSIVPVIPKSLGPDQVHLNLEIDYSRKEHQSTESFDYPTTKPLSLSAKIQVDGHPRI